MIPSECLPITVLVILMMVLFQGSVMKNVGNAAVDWVFQMSPQGLVSMCIYLNASVLCMCIPVSMDESTNKSVEVNFNSSTSYLHSLH